MLIIIIDPMIDRWHGARQILHNKIFYACQCGGMLRSMHASPLQDANASLGLDERSVGSNLLVVKPGNRCPWL